MSKYYVAVAGQHAGTCKALNWAWLSIRPFVAARGGDLGAVLEAAERRLGHDDITIHSYETYPG